MKLRTFILPFFLTIASGLCVFFFLTSKIFPAILFLGLAIFFFVRIIQLISSVYREVDEFTEAIQARDFSRKFPDKKIKKNRIYKHFNEITDAFLSLSIRNETQQQYLVKMLELVDTGIFAYNIETGETLWMNEALTNMLDIPHLKNMHWLKKRNETLYNEIAEIPLGEHRLVSIHSGKQTLKALTKASHFQTDGKTYKLIAFHNINATLEEVESGAWKSLLNVMTHEIMNSIAPVASLAETLKKRIRKIKEELGAQVPPDFEDIEFAMDTIHRRSEGLLQFSETYRNLSIKIVPNKQTVNLFELLNTIYQLMNPSLEMKGISLELKTDNPTIIAQIDRNLIEQVVINFITNATHALKEAENPSIVLFSGITKEGNPYLTVADNGCGIPDDIRDKIFVPFFSTKKGGSGIGLSLAREIVKMHKAAIRLQSQEGEGCAFTILMPVERGL
ncbi:sensor histidine kinase [Bacteroidia bacterium]|nr:sensor histidine kinase [Bacteroidia bacterium]GHV70923.1 sensor histidine kinase [Bacteroidia bacterium]